MIRLHFAGFMAWRRPSSAARWVARQQSRPLTAQEAHAFKEWLLQDPANREEYARLEGLGHLASQMRARADLVRELPAYAALKDRAAEDRVNAARRFALPALAAVAALGFALMFALRAPEPSAQGYRTSHGEQKEIGLPDGSIVHLNTDSALQVAFSGIERGVVLSRGEAYFEVVKEPGGRPFVVYSRGTQVRVVGTKFNVRARESGTDVIVSEGKVEVLPDPSRVSPSVPAKVELVPGNALRFDPVEQRVLIAAVDPERATAWRGGTIDFENVTLEEMVSEVNRYTATPFAIVDDRIRHVRLSGTFRVGDADSVRFALRDGFGIEAISRGDLVELRGP